MPNGMPTRSLLSGLRAEPLDILLPSKHDPHVVKKDQVGGKLGLQDDHGTTLAALTAGANTGAGGGTTLVPTAVQTSAYSAAVNDLVLCDTTSAAFTVTLPSAPADKSLVGVLVYAFGTGHNLTVARAGADQIMTGAGLATIQTLQYEAQCFVLQYDSGLAVWLPWAERLPLTSGLDSRYVGSIAAADGSIVIAGTTIAPTVKTGTLDVVAAAHPAAADWSNNSHKITSVADPSGAQDAMTKNYADGHYILGPGPVVSGDIVTFSGTTGLTVSDSGKVAPSGTIVGTTDTQSLTNKRVTKRVNSGATTGGSQTINGDTTDLYEINALAANLTLANPSGTPTDGQPLMVRLRDNGAIWTLAYGAQFKSRGATLPTATPGSSTTYVYIGLIWNADASTWDCVSISQG